MAAWKKFLNLIPDFIADLQEGSPADEMVF
jgi:hypothetical protein